MARLGRAQPFKPVRLKADIVGAPTAFVLTVAPGAIVTAGGTISLKYGRQISIGPGAIVTAGGTIGLKYGRKVTVGPGAITTGGSSLLLTDSGVDKVLTVAPGAKTLAGGTIALKYNRLLAITPGSIITRGGAIALTWSGETPVVTPTTPQGGKGRGQGRRRQKRVEVEIDGQVFEVASMQEGYDLLTKAREMARQAAKAAAERAIAKAEHKTTPAAQERALALSVPKIRIVEPDYGEDLAQQIQAQIEAAQAEVEQTYQQAMLYARAEFKRRQEAEEEEIIAAVVTLL